MNSMNDALPSYVVTPPAVTSLPVRGTKARFPIRRVYCVGRNYAAHAIEMGHDPNKEPPFFFQKNTDNVILAGTETFPYPPLTNDLHFEIELIVAIGKGGSNIPTAKALEHVYGYAVGLDMTRRDLQTQAKDMGRPWEVGKAFEKLGADRRDHPRVGDRPPRPGRDLARRRRQAPADRRPQPADLEGAGSDPAPLGAVRARARRHHHEWHAGRRGRGEEGRGDARPRRRRRRHQGPGRLSDAVRSVSPFPETVSRLSQYGRARHW